MNELKEVINFLANALIQKDLVIQQLQKQIDDLTPKEANAQQAANG